MQRSLPLPKNNYPDPSGGFQNPRRHAEHAWGGALQWGPPSPLSFLRLFSLTKPPRTARVVVSLLHNPNLLLHLHFSVPLRVTHARDECSAIVWNRIHG